MSTAEKRYRRAAGVVCRITHVRNEAPKVRADGKRVKRGYLLIFACKTTAIRLSLERYMTQEPVSCMSCLANG